MTDLTCKCGQPKAAGSLQCRTCAKAAFKQIAKYAVLVGAILSIVCHSLPGRYQAPCKALATVLSAC